MHHPGPRLRHWAWLVPLVLLGHALLLTGVTVPSGERASAPAEVLRLRTLQAPPPPPTSKPMPRRAPSRPAATAHGHTMTPPTAQVPSTPLQTSDGNDAAVQDMVAAQQEATPQDATPQDATPQDAAPQEAVPQDAPPPALPQAAASGPEPAPGPDKVWPLMSASALPAPTLLRYDLSGMDKGLNYVASGELRWQHDGNRYKLDLSVRAFLIGTRHWRSTGRIGPYGLEPARFSDSWRSERAAHFDREHARVVFSSTSQPAVLDEGAQDQVSLYVQLAAAMAADPLRFAPGAKLQVQTVSVRDGLPWSLQLEGEDTLMIAGKPRKVLKWVCQPHQRYSAQVVFWVAPEQAWLPLRIRITQVSGSYIDLLFSGSQPLPSLASGE